MASEIPATTAKLAVPGPQNAHEGVVTIIMEMVTGTTSVKLTAAEGQPPTVELENWTVTLAVTKLRPVIVIVSDPTVELQEGLTWSKDGGKRLMYLSASMLPDESPTLIEDSMPRGPRSPFPQQRVRSLTKVAHVWTSQKTSTPSSFLEKIRLGSNAELGH